MKKLGSKKVVATEYLSDAGFILARRILGLDAEIEYLKNVQISNLREKVSDRRFDVMVCSGVLYHMLNPMQAFTCTRKLMNDGGFLIVETPVLLDETAPVLRFNGLDPIFRVPYSYFIPSRDAVVGMAFLSGYELVAERILPKPYGRTAYLFKAVSRGYLLSVASCPDFVKETLKRDIVDLEFSFKMLEERCAVSSDVITKFPIRRAGVINFNEFNLDFPFQPKLNVVGVGESAWETAMGNNKLI